MFRDSVKDKRFHYKLSVFRPWSFSHSETCDIRFWTLMFEYVDIYARYKKKSNLKEIPYLARRTLNTNSIMQKSSGRLKRGFHAFYWLP